MVQMMLVRLKFFMGLYSVSSCEIHSARVRPNCCCAREFAILCCCVCVCYMDLFSVCDLSFAERNCQLAVTFCYKLRETVQFG